MIKWNNSEDCWISIGFWSLRRYRQVFSPWAKKCRRMWEKCGMFGLTGNVVFAGIVPVRKPFLTTIQNSRTTLDAIAMSAIRNIQVLVPGIDTSPTITYELCWKMAENKIRTMLIANTVAWFFQTPTLGHFLPIGISTNFINAWHVRTVFWTFKVSADTLTNAQCLGRKWSVPPLFMIVELAVNCQRVWKNCWCIT